MIKFNIPAVTGKEHKYINKAISNRLLAGDNNFTKLCHKWFEKSFKCKKALLTTSCTHALEMAAIISNIKEGDEVIMSSYTFVSTANAFVLRGAKIVFVDIRPDTMNIDENLIEPAITSKTKAIVVVHYAGVSCEMDKIMAIAKKHNLIVIEDAAQGVMSKYKDEHLGTIGDIGCYSFHETKNYTCGEGGAIIINNPKFIERAEIIREKGTNRSKFFRGEIDKYTWIDLGSSYLPSELNAAYLYAQLQNAEKINKNRIKSWETYHKLLLPLKKYGNIQLPQIPEACTQNGHLFYIKTKDLKERSKLIEFLKKHKINAVFHYIPLHSSTGGKKFGDFYGKDTFTTKESERLLRLPLYYKIEKSKIIKVCKQINNFFNEKKSSQNP